MYKIHLNLPKKMLDLAKAPDIASRPSDLCLECPFLSVSCAGPEFFTMVSDRWMQWANARAKKLGLTRQDIADRSGIPIGTVQSVMSGRTRDARHSTMCAITTVLIGENNDLPPCHLAHLIISGQLTVDESVQELEFELNELREKYRSLRERFDDRVAEVKADENKKVQYLREQLAEKDAELKHKEKRVTRLMFLVLFFILAAVVLLVADICIPGNGWLHLS